MGDGGGNDELCLSVDMIRYEVYLWSIFLTLLILTAEVLTKPYIGASYFLFEGTVS